MFRHKGINVAGADRPRGSVDRNAETADRIQPNPCICCVTSLAAAAEAAPASAPATDQFQLQRRAEVAYDSRSVCVCVCIGIWETAMTPRAPVGALRYVVGLLMFVVFDSLQTDIKQREYQLIPCIFIIHLRQASNVDVTKDAVFSFFSSSSFFLFHFPAKIRARFSSVQTSDRIETLT